MKATAVVNTLAMALFGLALAAGAVAQPAAKAPMRNLLSEEDRTFLMMAAADGLAEVEAAKAAQRKAVQPRTKAIAARMVADHQKANEELPTLAARKGVSLPSAPDQEQQAASEKMQAMPGPEYDSVYIGNVVASHEKAVDLFGRTSQDAKDPDVKAFASRTLPTLREHLKMARSAQKM